MGIEMDARGRGSSAARVARADLAVLLGGGDWLGDGGGMRNQKFDAQLETMRAIHDAKNSDYAEDGNPYSNFEHAAAVAGCSVDTVFRVLIGVKLARLKELLGGKEPKHESIDDSILDLSVYAALWASYRR